MSLSIKIDVKLIAKGKGDVEGFLIGEDEILPFGQAVKEMWVIHPEESEAGTCEECAALAGKIFDGGDGEFPPVHANCNCERVPIMETFDLKREIWNKPKAELSMTKAKLDNMADDALSELVEADNIDAPTMRRVKAILSKRKAR